MPSGMIVFRSKDHLGFCITCYRVTESRLQKVRTLPATCGHHTTNILGMKVNVKELLAVACSVCQSIKLLNLATQEVSVAFRNDNHSPGEMCLGDKAEMFVSNPKGILHLNCSSEEFKILQVISTKTQCFTYISEQKLLAVLHGPISKGMAAISTETSEATWLTFVCGWPMSVAYFKGLNVLFAATQDGLVAFNGEDGSWQPLGGVKKEVGDNVYKLCVDGDRLIVQCSVRGMTKIVIFKLPC